MLVMIIIRYFFVISSFLCVSELSLAQSSDTSAAFVFRSEAQLFKKSASPNKGKGDVLGCAFFDDLKDCTISFRKRVLQRGASLGKHMQKHDEIYYVVSGEGTIRINDNPLSVKAGDAVLTKKGNSHELIQAGEEDLAILVVFAKPQ
jgi:mannose-6-phosphate isomerase-like protein (cupin superfamily)